MTTQQLADRMGVSQPRVPELEKAEVSGNITLKSLERAAAALGCRVVYAFVPERPLADIVRERARLIADRQFAAVSHSMQLENQGIGDAGTRAEQRERLIEQLMLRPARALGRSVSDIFNGDDKATPITPEERAALIPTHVTLRQELNELEQQNILEASSWAFGRKRNVFSETFLRGLIAECSTRFGNGPATIAPRNVTRRSLLSGPHRNAAGDRRRGISTGTQELSDG